MPIHDWSRVDRSLYHDFYLSWVVGIARSLNAGCLPASHYWALIENHRDGRTSEFVAMPEQEDPKRDPSPDLLAIPESPPHTSFHDVCTHPEYAEKVISIRRSGLANVVAAIRIVAAETKRSRYRLDQFVAWCVEALRDGVALLIVDPFPPGRWNPQGIHKAIWDEFVDNDFALPNGRPVTLVSYAVAREPEAFTEPVAFGTVLPDMPLFLDGCGYVLVPLEDSYQATWDSCAEVVRDLVERADE